MTCSEAAAKGDLDGEVSSKALSKSQALLDAEIKAILNDDSGEVGAATENETSLPDGQATFNVEAARNSEDLPPPP